MPSRCAFILVGFFRRFTRHGRECLAFSACQDARNLAETNGGWPQTSHLSQASSWCIWSTSWKEDGTGTRIGGLPHAAHIPRWVHVVLLEAKDCTLILGRASVPNNMLHSFLKDNWDEHTGSVFHPFLRDESLTISA